MLAGGLLAGGCGQGLGDFSEPTGATASAKATRTVCASGASYTTIAAALSAASNGDVIDICAGTYAERLTISGKTMTLRGTSGAASTILDGKKGGTVLYVSSGANVTITGLTVKNGKGSSVAGGIRCDGSTISLASSVVTSSTGKYGAGVGMTNCVYTVTGNTISSNTDYSTYGGGLYATGGSGTITGNTFTGNKGGRGGAVSVVGDATTISGNTMTGNTANHGGAIWLDGNGPITGNTITGNTVTWYGGGIYVENSAGEISGNTVSDNTATDDGGGMFLDRGTNLVLDNVIEYNDAVDDAGGIRVKTGIATIEGNVVRYNTAVDEGGGMKLSHRGCFLYDNDISENYAGDRGGGIALDQSESTIVGLTMVGNDAAYGAGINVYDGWDPATIEDAYIAGNAATVAGAGIYLDLAGDVTIVRQSEFNGNTAPVGAGIFSQTSELEVENVILHWNVATTSGGAIGGSGMTGSMVNAVVYRNTAPSGAGMQVDAGGAFVVDNTVFYKAQTGAAVAVGSGTAPTVKYSDFYGNASDFAGMTTVVGSNGNLGVHPLFGDASGGDFSLQTSSPLVDAGDPAILDVDGTRSDVGAFGGPSGAW